MSERIEVDGAKPADSGRVTEALRTIKYSIQQARILGNDWKRELALIENTVDAALAAQGQGEKMPVPASLDRTHKNKAYVTMGFEDEQACTRFCKAISRGRDIYTHPAAHGRSDACSYCNGSGDVHSIDGEWRGECTECPAAMEREFKNFHRQLCERFSYTHDEKDWRRDQVSLIEHIAMKLPAPASGVPDGWAKDIALLLDAVDGIHGHGATDGNCKHCDAVNRLSKMLAAAPSAPESNT